MSLDLMHSASGFHRAAEPVAKDVKKFYSENIPTKMKDFDVRQLEGKWYKVRGYNPKYDCYPCQTNTFKYNAQTNKMETEVKLRVAHLGEFSDLSCFWRWYLIYFLVPKKYVLNNFQVYLRRKKSGGFWENVLTEKMDVQNPSDRSTLQLGSARRCHQCHVVPIWSDWIACSDTASLFFFWWYSHSNHGTHNPLNIEVCKGRNLWPVISRRMVCAWRRRWFCADGVRRQQPAGQNVTQELVTINMI